MMACQRKSRSMRWHAPKLAATCCSLRWHVRKQAIAKPKRAPKLAIGCTEACCNMLQLAMACAEASCNMLQLAIDCAEASHS